MFGRLASLFRKPAAQPADYTPHLLDAIRSIEARYEAAEPSDDLWQMADFVDADAAMRPRIRRTINSRSQHEFDNNPVIRRCVDTFVADVVGESGPLLQVSCGDTAIDRLVESAWSEWWSAACGAQMLATAVRTQAIRGEAVGIRRTRESLLRHSPVSLDVRLVEPERLASPNFGDDHRKDYIDGIHLDPITGEPLAYDILKAHPGNQYVDAFGLALEAATFDADEIYHVFRRLRPEQHRGVAETAPALPTAADHRKFLTATRKSAQLAAYLSLIGTTDLGPDTSIPAGANANAWQTLSLPNSHGGLMLLPFGHDVKQMEARHPNNTLQVFHQVLVSMTAACFNMPLSRALGWHTVTGYAAIRGELLAYEKRINSDRRQMWEPHLLTRLYREFLDELLLSHPAFAGTDLTGRNLLNIEWQWSSGDLVVDPSRDETARSKRLAMGTTHRAAEMRVRDLDTHDDRAARGFGMTVAEYRRAIARATFNLAKEELPLDESDVSADAESSVSPEPGEVFA